MTKVIGMLVALAMFCAIPGVAFAQAGDDQYGGCDGIVCEPDDVDASGETPQGGETPQVDGDNVTSGDIDQSIDGGGDNVQCAISQAAGGDAEATNNCGNTNVDAEGEGGEGGGGEGGGDDEGVTGVGVGGDEGVGGDVGGGGVGGVTLAQTGFDAWLLALLGGLSLAGGLGLLVAQRRGRIGA